MRAQSCLCAVCLSLVAALAHAVAPPQAEPDWPDDPLYRACGSLVSWWPADGHALDLAGKNHGARAAGVGFEQGQSGLAFSFSGNSGETVATRTPALTGTFTLALWVLPRAARTTSSFPSRYLGASGQRYAVYPSHGGPAGTHAGCGLSVGSNGVGLFEHTHDNLPAVLTHDVPIKGWVHVAAVYSAGRPTLYLDGKAVQSGQRSRWTVFPGTILGDPSNQYGPYHGLVDEVMLFSRALDAAEVAALLGAPRPGRRLPLAGAPFARLWATLSGEQAPRSLFAVTRLAASGDEAVRRLGPCLRPRKDPRKRAVAQLIAQLDDDSFAVRERATRLLIERGPGVRPKLRKVLRGKPSLEVRTRIARVLRRLTDPPPTATDLRALRAIAALARIDTPASRALLAEIADGPDPLPAGAAGALLERRP
jgi:hypothetical protein